MYTNECFSLEYIFSNFFCRQNDSASTVITLCIFFVSTNISRDGFPCYGDFAPNLIKNIRELSNLKVIYTTFFSTFWLVRSNYTLISPFKFLSEWVTQYSFWLVHINWRVKTRMLSNVRKMFVSYFENYVLSFVNLCFFRWVKWTILFEAWTMVQVEIGNYFEN